MSNSLPQPRLEAAALGHCCHSVVLIENTMSRLALLQSYFTPAATQDLCGEAAGAVSVLGGSWSELKLARDLLSNLVEEGAHHV